MKLILKIRKEILRAGLEGNRNRYPDPIKVKSLDPDADLLNLDQAGYLLTQLTPMSTSSTIATNQTAPELLCLWLLHLPDGLQHEVAPGNIQVEDGDIVHPLHQLAATPGKLSLCLQQQHQSCTGNKNS